MIGDVERANRRVDGNTRARGPRDGRGSAARRLNRSWSGVMEALLAAGILFSFRVDSISGSDQTERFHGTKAGQVRDDNGLKMRLIWCPAGEFTMGSPAQENGRNENEMQVQVKLTKGFWLGQHEITQSEWQQVMKTTPWAGQDFVKEGPNHPATYVSWEDAGLFCVRLTASEQKAGSLPVGWRYALPTEAQWEYACRAGTKSRFSFGDHETDLGKYAWCKSNAEECAHEVAQKKPNRWGLYDMNGNVWELCRDCYRDRLPGGTDPELRERGADNPQRVIRGGGWSDPPSDCSAAHRWMGMRFLRIGDLGFRVAVVPASQ